MIVRVQQKGWLDGTFMMRWVKEVYLKYTGGKESLLAMDTFSAHCSNDIVNLLSKHYSSVALILGGCTSQQQPLDVSLNKAFKQVCRQEFQIYCHSQLATIFSSADSLTIASKQDICQWVVKAQNYLSAHPEMIIKSFKVTGIPQLWMDLLFRNKDILQQADQPEDEEKDEDEEDPLALTVTVKETTRMMTDLLLS